LIGLGALAIVSTVFGMMMAVASDLPQLENKQQYKAATNSYLYDDQWRPIGIFAPPNHVVIDTYDQISESMKDAIVSVEDKRFWTDPGVDIRGTARALLADATGGARQGASTISQQFVKNALSEQGNRTVLEKLREAALAYQLTRKWSKTKILTEYLNSIYFGNGAYGVESAARVYFGKIHGFDPNSAIDGSTNGCGDSPRPSCASVLAPWEAALLAGMVASPSAFDPVANPHDARARRNLVLKDMLQQNDITLAQYNQGIAEPLPTANDIEQPEEPGAAPYFTSWLRPQILAAMGLGHGVAPRIAEYRAYYGGLKIRTTIDLKMQQAAEQAVAEDLPYNTEEGQNQPRRWWRSTTRPARFARWSAARSSTGTRTTSSSRSISRPRVSGSPARRSSRSRLPWRSPQASTRPTR
jgi:penicillin-binding protein 1A